MLTEKDIDSIIKENFESGELSSGEQEILSIFKKGLDEATDKEETYDVSIDGINRLGHDFSFIAIFRADRKYSTVVRMRVDSELLNSTEDYARKIMPEMTVLRYRIPIYEEGRLFRKFLLENRKPLVTDNIKVSNSDSVMVAKISDMYDDLIEQESPLNLLMPAFRRLVPYKSIISVLLVIDDISVGNIGVASVQELDEHNVDLLSLMAKMISGALSKVGLGKGYG